MSKPRAISICLLAARFRYASLLAGLLGLSACAPVDLLNATISRDGLTVTRDVAYGHGPRERLDVYAPRGAAHAPVVVFIYGGSWNSGSKNIYPFVAATLARRGVVVLVPDYRLFPEVRFPAFVQDCAKAVAWAEAHAQSLGADPDRVFVAGHSAGAYNAAMLALDPRYLAAAGGSRDRLAGFIGLAGPYDFLPITGEDIKPIFAPVHDGPASQPVTYVDGHAPPMLLMAGADDKTVLPRNSLSLAAHVRAAGGEAAVKIYPGVGHIGLVLAIAPWFQGRAPVLADMLAFVAAHRERLTP